MKVTALLSTVSLLFLLGGCEFSPQSGSFAGGQPTETPQVQTKESQAAMTPEAAQARLDEGNSRFVEGRSKTRDLPAKVAATAGGQYPFAVVLSCLDSRQPIELLFDQSIGDMFNARIAGNILNDDILGSMEFACKVSGAKLIVVLGHTNCGAVKGAIDNVELGHLTGLLHRIKPAINAVPADGQPRTSKNDAFVQQVADANAKLAKDEIARRSPILREMLEKKEIGMVAGMYDLSTGRVRFFPASK